MGTSPQYRSHSSVGGHGDSWGSQTGVCKGWGQDLRTGSVFHPLEHRTRTPSTGESSEKWFKEAVD